MPLAVLLAAIAGYVYAMLAKPGFRFWGLIGGVAVALALVLYLRGGSQRPEIDPAELTIDALTVERSARGAVMQGRVLNASPDFRLLDMTLKLRLRDCPEPEAESETCPIIGEAQTIARPDAPAGQIRGFSAPFTFANLPPLVGTLAWDWEIVATRAAAD
jgi:hypothetical protein